jgi:hypothetical protein
MNGQDDRPQIVNDEGPPFVLKVKSTRVNRQPKHRQGMPPNSFIFIDEPGLQLVFIGMSGYGEVATRRDIEAFLVKIDRPRGEHLCSNPDWDFLLSLYLGVFSLWTCIATASA